jgi:hypothetical protein
VDLSGARAAIELLMENATVEVVRDPEGRLDDTWHEELGEYVTQPGDLVVIYTGPGYVADVAAAADTTDQGQATRGKRVASLPYDVPEIPENSKLTVLTNPDPELVGQEFRVTGVVKDTLHIERTLVLERAFNQVRGSWTPTST